ncbi:Oligosaccharide translocation protein rft1 [Cryptotrichosporon argae]
MPASPPPPGSFSANAPAAPTTATPAPAPTLASALSTARALVLLQLVTRLLTFALNQTLVRLAPPEVFGTAAIQFDLVASTILFLSREGVRHALLRGAGGANVDAGGTDTRASAGNAGDGAVRARQAARLAQVPVQAGVLVAAAVVSLYVTLSDARTVGQPGFSRALALYVTAALLELAVEPHHVRALRSGAPGLRARVQAEGGAAMVRAGATAAWVARAGAGSALVGFAVGQAAGAGWLAGRYVWAYGLDGLVYSSSKGEPRFAPDQARLAVANARQGVVKHVLTEADRLAVGRISPLGDQGGYAVAINYGSLIARIVFQPIEESLLLHLSRADAGASASSSASSSGARSLASVPFVVHLSTHLLVLCPAFLPPLLPAVLPLLLPGRYAHTTAASTLATYLTAYIPLLSLNGILEAVHAATARPADLARQARWMAASSAAFVAALVALTQGTQRTATQSHSRALPVLGHITTEQALVYASCAAMAVRITYAAAHAHRYLAPRGLTLSVRAALPKPPVLAAAAAAGLALRVTAAWLGPDPPVALRALLVGEGMAWTAVVLGVAVVVERADFAALQRVMRAKTE